MTAQDNKKYEDRFAEFDSAAAAAGGRPIAFRLDGDLWDCHPVPTTVITRHLVNATDMSLADFITECVTDREGWVKRIEDPERPVPNSVIAAVFNFIVKQYFGVDTESGLGKSDSLPPSSSATGGPGKKSSGKRVAAPRSKSPAVN